MTIIGNIKKMQSKHTNPISYKIPIGENFLPISNYLGSKINIEYLDEINCIGCNRSINKSFAQGHCYPCFINSPETSECVLRPELCRAHKGESRDMEWSKIHCLREHFVYIALTAAAKVGVTRSTQIPIRWIDQGAVQAIKLAKTSNRHEAGLIEIELKQHISDRTAWQKMLKHDIDKSINLNDLKNMLIDKLSKSNKKFIDSDNNIIDFNYPHLRFPEKIKSINLLKEPSICDTLIAIKGQYLLFNDNKVINIRKHAGFKVSISIE